MGRTILKNTTLLLTLFVLLAFVSSAAFADKPNFILIIGDAPGEGFNDPTPVDRVGINGGTTLGAQRINAFSFALSIWAQELNSNTPIIVLAYFDPLDCDATTGNVKLGSAGATTIWSDFPNAPFSNTWYSSALSDHLYGADIDPGAPDIVARFNSNLDKDCIPGFGWYYGLDGKPSSRTLDIIPTLLHELTHGLGFQNFVNELNGEFIQGIPDIYSRYTLDVTREKPLARNGNGRRASQFGDQYVGIGLGRTGREFRFFHPSCRMSFNRSYIMKQRLSPAIPLLPAAPNSALRWMQRASRENWFGPPIHREARRRALHTNRSRPVALL